MRILSSATDRLSQGVQEVDMNEESSSKYYYYYYVLVEIELLLN